MLCPAAVLRLLCAAAGCKRQLVVGGNDCFFVTLCCLRHVVCACVQPLTSPSRAGLDAAWRVCCHAKSQHA